MSKAAKGRRREYQVIEQLQADGWHTVRSAASKGAFDVVGISKHGFRCIQVKSVKRFANISKDERARLLEAAENVPGNCSIEVWIFVDRQKPRIEFLKSL